MRFRWKYVWQGMKVACGAAAAILIAQALGLQFAVTAGIICILAIHGTKKETLTVAVGRLAAFVCALLLAWGSYVLLGYTVTGFEMYLFLFAVLCYACRWGHAIAMVSVLMSHFLTWQAMTLPLIANEALLLLVGTVCGVAVNLHLHPDDKRMAKLVASIDERMKELFEHLSHAAIGCDDTATKQKLSELASMLKQAAALAVTNANNRLFDTSMQEMRYLSMRTQQRKILGQIADAMSKLRFVPPQWENVSLFFGKIAAEYHRENDCAALLHELNSLLDTMRIEPLPTTRPEFESRALLYYILRRMEDFLLLKRQYCADTDYGTLNNQVD